jgi:hypothetical protein
VFYRVEDIETLSGPQFLSLAARVSAYQGVMAARLTEQNNGTEVRNVAANQATVAADPVLSGLVSWGGG